MPKKVTMKRKTDKDIILEYGYGYADLMDLFGVSRQMAFTYLRGESVPSSDRLREVIVSHPGEMEAAMCREILANRGFVLVEDLTEVIA